MQLNTRLLIIILTTAIILIVFGLYLTGDSYTSSISQQSEKSSELLTSASFVDLPPDEIVEKLIAVTNDGNMEKISDSKQNSVYTTQKGDIRITKENTNSDYSQFVDYSIHGKENAIPKDQAEIFADYVFGQIGYKRDGSEWVDMTDFGNRKEIVIQQRKDGWIIENEMHRFNFQNDMTSIQIGHWYTNLDAFEIKYSQDDAKKIAYDFIQSKINSDSRLREMNLEISYPEYTQMKILQDHLVYGISGIYPHIEIQVDTHSGNIVNADLIKISGKEMWGCASIGVSRLTAQDIAKMQKMGELLYFELTDDDLKQLPILEEMIDTTNSRTEYNDRVALPISIPEWNDYDNFIKEKFKEQHETYYKTDLQNIHILYNDKRYGVYYNENYPDTPLWVESFPDNFDYEQKTITILGNELANHAPKIKEAINMMGTWEVSVWNSTSILENEQQRYQEYLHQKTIEKYGSDPEQYVSIFYYDGSYYEPSFAIC